MATLIRSINQLSGAQQGGVVTIGNFDGVHLGHQALIKRVMDKAAAQKLPVVVVTFEPHAFEFFSPGNPTIPRLTRLREKFNALKALGVENILILNFNQSLANVSASEFVADILYKHLKMQHVIIGDDFRFGHKRQGDFALFAAMGKKLHFSVEAMPTLTLKDDRISSTRIRQALQEGNHHLANDLLGRPYTMQGRVACGDQLGRKLGFRTANIFLHRRLSPVAGIYTVYVQGISKEPLPGVANVGTRPTVDGTKALLEVHLLDFNDDIYGRYVTIEFCQKLREEVRYPNLDLLTEQIAKDVQAARTFFNMV